MNTRILVTLALNGAAREGLASRLPEAALRFSGSSPSVDELNWAELILGNVPRA